MLKKETNNPSERHKHSKSCATTNHNARDRERPRNVPYLEEEEETKKLFSFQEMNEEGEYWSLQMNEDSEDEDFTIVVVWFAMVCVMREIKNLLCFNFAVKNLRWDANINHSEI